MKHLSEDFQFELMQKNSSDRFGFDSAENRCIDWLTKLEPERRHAEIKCAKLELDTMVRDTTSSPELCIALMCSIFSFSDKKDSYLSRVIKLYPLNLIERIPYYSVKNKWALSYQDVDLLLDRLTWEAAYSSDSPVYKDVISMYLMSGFHDFVIHYDAMIKSANGILNKHVALQHLFESDVHVESIDESDAKLLIEKFEKIKLKPILVEFRTSNISIFMQSLL